MGEPRGIIPTYVTDQRFMLAKAAPSVRGTYEIRLAVYFAVQRQSAFTLVVKADATVNEELLAYISKWGGQVVRDDVSAFSVSFTAESAEGEELDTWVLGDQERWIGFRDSLASPWLKERLQLGAAFSAADLERLVDGIKVEQFAGTNLDGEPLQAALLTLAEMARQKHGRLFLQ